ncbi:MAG: 16S rRNA (adenine(1518)-N(6)/adenine(1519)-N(6))-dimethyltransferase RsmA [Acidobacteriota bacterium]|nr:16S rRNA (adenine(1518)-N(6)/adenine(1519)-N(6))-dimethyltransferase RsmA [Acidobacteriota bacterium]
MGTPRLKKKLGQHHLISSDLCLPLVEFLRPDGWRVLEVGPGGGVLTTALLDHGARVDAIEMDPEWAFRLRRLETRAALGVIVGDAMTLAWERLGTPALVAGNLPYQIATPLIERLLPLHRVIPRASFLVQREVGERLGAAPGAAAYGSLSVIVAAYADVEMLGRVARGSFRPAPKVEGEFVGLRLRRPVLPEEQMNGFVATVRLAFSLRRKTLRNALASRWGKEQAARVVEALDLGARVRAEELDLDSFVRLRALAESTRQATGET